MTATSSLHPPLSGKLGFSCLSLCAALDPESMRQSSSDVL